MGSELIGVELIGVDYHDRIGYSSRRCGPGSHITTMVLDNLYSCPPS